MLGTAVLDHLGVAHGPLEGRQQGAVPLELGVGRIAGLDAAEAAGHDLNGRHALAGRDGLLERRGDGGFQGEVVGAQDDIDVWILGQPRYQHRLAGVGADAGKPDLAGLLGGLLGVDQVVGDLFRLAFGVQIPDIQVIGLQRLQTGIQVVERVLLGERHGSCSTA